MADIARRQMMYPVHQRKPIRLRDYDYAQAGLYFITICTKNREPLFGKIDAECIPVAVDLVGANLVGADPRSALIKSPYGEIVESVWFDLVNHNPGIKLHEFIVMPNHIHGIVEIDLYRVDLGSTPTSRPLSEIVRQFKGFSTRRINELRETIGAPVWQRNYYEHIIRNEESYLQIAEYIVNNPARWRDDELYVA